MTHTLLKRFLAVGTAITLSAAGLSACSQSPSEMKEKATGMTEAAKEKMSNVSYKTLEFNTPGQTNDDHLYLEEVLGEAALSDVKGWNERTLERLTSDPRFGKMQADALEILNSKDKIPYVSYRGGEVHNFWQDASHVRGVWRKSTLESYLSENTQWETVLDFDKLAKDEGKNWVYKGNNCLGPDYELCIVNLSDGGKDAVVRREFNTRTKSWVEDGFVTEESKGSTDWLDQNTLLVSVDFGEGTMTDSGYPMVSKVWTRGEPISEAVEIFRGKSDDVGAGAGAIELADGSKEIIIYNSTTFYDRAHFWVPGIDGKLLDANLLPSSMMIGAVIKLAIS